MKKLIDLGEALSSNGNTYTHPLFISQMNFKDSFIPTREFFLSVLNSRNPSVYFKLLLDLNIPLTGSFGEFCKLSKTTHWEEVLSVLDHSRKRLFACPHGVYYILLLCLLYRGTLPVNEVPILSGPFKKFSEFLNFFDIINDTLIPIPEIYKSAKKQGFDVYEGVILFEVHNYFKDPSLNLTNILSPRSKRLVEFEIFSEDEDGD